MQIEMETAVAAVADRLTIAGSAGAVLGWLTSSQAGILIGILIGVAGLVINWHFKRKNDKRQELAHQAFMARLVAQDKLPIPEYEREDD